MIYLNRLVQAGEVSMKSLSRIYILEMNHMLLLGQEFQINAKQ